MDKSNYDDVIINKLLSKKKQYNYFEWIISKWKCGRSWSLLVYGFEIVYNIDEVCDIIADKKKKTTQFFEWSFQISILLYFFINAVLCILN
jgi:hypothetical protein